MVKCESTEQLLAALFIRGYTLKRAIVRSDDKDADGNLEKGKSEVAVAEEQGKKKSVRGSMRSSQAGSGEIEREDTVAEHTAQGGVTEVQAEEVS